MATPAMPEPPKAEAKSDAKGDAKMPPPPPAPMAMLPMANLAEMTAAKTKDAMEQATKIAEALSAQWPKCRFHIASVTPFQGGGAVMMAGPGMNAQMLVTLSGESGCLATGK